MKKKLLTVALAATMVVGSVFSAVAATATSFSGAVFAENTGREELTGDFDVTYTFDMKSTAATENYHSFIVEVMGNNGTINGFLDLRADAYGWWASKAGDEMWAEAGTIAFTNDFTFSGAKDANWIAIIKDAKVTVNLKRAGETLTVTYKIVGANGTTVNMSAPIANSKGFGSKISVTLTSELSTLSNIVFKNNATSAAGTTTAAGTAAGTTTVAAAAGATTTKASKTGDNTASTVALVTVAAVGAMFVVLASRKSKVTE